MNNQQLFKSVTAFLEIRLDGQASEQAFTDTIERQGGKVLKTLGKSVTHVVWANGKLHTLLKASEL